ncbi:glycosyltransferase family protein [Mesorhizobium xinjiangense]|uniref:glycosyl transferase family 1 n=1 Tax=Mesorhizobium xinjiangense TaxID=2678685 RepID=UPI0018DD45F4|nr:glycosyl transferase family 1 [Mesorhizobium xinjiangense]
MLNVLYLVHDLSDPAVRRRLVMLQTGGANVTIAGFRRGVSVAELRGVAPIEIGTTQDGRFAQRLRAVGRAACSLGGKLRAMPRPDIIVARTLEMLALANRANAIFGGDVPIVYECLDIHRLMLRSDMVGGALRQAERRFAGNVVLLMTSSPAFVREYFDRIQPLDLPLLLMENKVLDLRSDALQPADGRPAPQAGEPWRIGWFGALRCRKSLALLAEFSRRHEGRFEIVLRGRPAYSEFEDFDRFVAAEPYLRFEGPYRNPEDLAAIYGEVHFAWAVDFFEEGLNSDWLLPNRLYEGCRHGAIPIAMERTETGRVLAERGLGLRLSGASQEDLSERLGRMDADTYEGMRRSLAAQDPASWVHRREDCRAFVARLEDICASGADGAREMLAA